MVTLGTTLETAIAAIVGGCIAYLFGRLRVMEQKMEKAMSKEDIRDLIDDKNKPLQVLLTEQKEDIKEVKQLIMELAKNRK